LAELTPFTKSDEGVRVRIRLTPKAAQTRVDGVVADAQGNGVLRIAVTTVPEHGRANTALIKLLVKQWRVPKSAMTLVQGSKDRNKVLQVAGDANAIMATLDNWANGLKNQE